MERIKLYCHLCKRHTTLVYGIDGKYWMKRCKVCRHHFCSRFTVNPVYRIVCGYPRKKKKLDKVDYNIATLGSWYIYFLFS